MLSRLGLLFKKLVAYFKVPNFGCKQCGECCSKYTICVTHKDVYRIFKNYGFDPHEFLDYTVPDESVEESFKGIPRFIGEDGRRWILCLKENEEGSCYFNDSGPCSIYAFRPLVCRAFPFLWQRMKYGYRFVLNREALEFCRGLWAVKNRFDFAAVSRDMIQSEKEDKEYAELVEEWNQLVERKEIKSPSLKEFINFFMKKLLDEENEF